MYSFPLKILYIGEHVHIWLILKCPFIRNCFYGDITYSEFTPFYHQFGIIAHEEGIEGDMIDREIHPALLG